MKTAPFTLALFLVGCTLIAPGIAFAQLPAPAGLAPRPVQTVRGTIIDASSKAPVIGATVRMPGTTIGAITDTEGRFRIPTVPVGRVKLIITSVGYEDLTLNEVMVNAGKEVVLDLPLTESVRNLAEVQVRFNRAEDRTVTNNEMATVSARPFDAAETIRYAGSLGDPSRMAANFAGVSGANDSRNDIIVRGNSPASLLWRLDGVNIPNPNHFGALGASGGPVSVLNTNLLAKSDFLTGAFPAEYANALGSVFDVRLRRGNDEKREFLGQVGFNGLEVGAEGPYSLKPTASGRKASFLINYRYSLFSLMQNIGFKLAGATEYQDFTAKTDVPVGTKGTLSAWVIGGRSQISFLGKDVKADNPDAFGDESINNRVKTSVGMGAVSYEHRFNSRTYGRVVLSGSRQTERVQLDTVLYGTGRNSTGELPARQTDYVQEKLSLNASLTHKVSAKDKVSGGLIMDLIQFNLANQQVYPISGTSRNATGETSQLQAYGQWKHRFNNRLTLNTGLSWLYLQLNGSSALEPRAGLSYQVSPQSSINVAYGLHSTVQSLLTYFYQTRQPSSAYALTNRDLGFTRSHHAVVSYDRQLTSSVRLKVEGYHQWLFNAPVERTASYFSTLTQGAGYNQLDKGNLVNQGTGRNYGVELTLEKNFTNNYYFLLTTSLFESKYTGSDGMERNTPFNNRYVVNALAGREFRVGRRNNVLNVNWKLTTAGSQYMTPINLKRSAQRGEAMYDYDRAFSQRQNPYFRADLKFGYKMNRTRLTHEFALDLQNVTGNQNVLQQAYNPRTNRVGTAYQQGFLPVPFYRLTF